MSFGHIQTFTKTINTSRYRLLLMTTLVSPLGVNKTIESFQIESGMTCKTNGSGDVAGKEIFLMDLELLGWSHVVPTTHNLRNVTSYKVSSGYDTTWWTNPSRTGLKHSTTNLPFLFFR